MPVATGAISQAMRLAREASIGECLPWASLHGVADPSEEV